MRFYESANLAWLGIMTDLHLDGRECAPRGLKILEIENYSLCITNPKKRLITNPVRKISLPYAFGELLWYLRGDNDLQSMEYYSARMKNFSDDGLTLNSAYGHRIFGRHKSIGFNQWQHVVKLLKADPDSRQAIIHLHTPNDQPTKDEVCTLTLQFMVRGGRLNMYTNMRSNDAVMGFTYDVFSFTSLQELMANELGVEVGAYYHNAASMHIYERDLTYMHRAVANVKEFEVIHKLYDVEYSFDGVKIGDDCLYDLQYLEYIHRKIPVTESQKKAVFLKTMRIASKKFLLDMANVLYNYSNHKHGLGQEPISDDNREISWVQQNYLSSSPSFYHSSLVIFEGPDGVGKSTAAMDFLLSNPSYSLVHFGKVTDKFEPIVYLHSLMQSDNLVLDRSFFSEVVYSEYYDRESLINEHMLDALLGLCSDLKPDIRFYQYSLLDRTLLDSRISLSMDDKHLDIERLNSLYEYLYVTLLESGIVVKNVIRK